jgi:hypothetical protein
MKKLFGLFTLALCLAGALTLAACVQMPTEKQGVADIRPQISFQAGNEQVKGASILVDGLSVGTVGDYLNGISSLRVLSGTHLVTVLLGNQVLLEQKFYVGDGVSRSFTVNK